MINAKENKWIISHDHKCGEVIIRVRFHPDLFSAHMRPLAAYRLQSECTAPPQVTSNTYKENKGKDTVQCMMMGIWMPNGLRNEGGGKKNALFMANEAKANGIRA